MSSRVFQLKEKVLQHVPEGELPWVLFTKIAMKSGINLKTVNENSDAPEDKIQRAVAACKEIFGPSFNF